MSAAGLASDQQRFFIELNAWARETFPASTTETIIAHMRREIVELKQAQADAELQTDRHVIEEKADVFMMLLDLAAILDIDPFSREMLQAAQAKLAVVKRRRWGKADAEGVIEHVRED